MGIYGKWALALVAPLLLAGCLLIPGKFDSQLRLMNDGTYSFTYNGQMQLSDDDKSASSQSAMMAFDPEEQHCSNQIDKNSGEITPLRYGADEFIALSEGESDPYAYEDRPCTEEELAEMEQDHNERMAMMDGDSGASSKQDDEQKNAAMRSIFGGAVPGDDEGLKKFAEQLAKYDGWNKVEYVGDNMFEVEYAVSGNFDQMFAFPTIPGATMQFPFVQIIRRGGGEIEVLTPGLSGPGGLLGALGPMATGVTTKQTMKPIDGNFIIETDAEILSNNTADGYATTGAMKKLQWKVNEASSAGGSPRAILKLKK